MLTWPAHSASAIRSHQPLNLAALIADIDVATEEEKLQAMPSLFERAAAIGLTAKDVTEVINQAAKEWIGWREVQRFSR